jgi:hypothetical protein
MTANVVTVTKEGPHGYLVEVVVGNSATTHHVEVPAGLAAEIGGAGTSEERLVEESFSYLLEREPNTSILRKFSLDQIGDYFPRWASDLKKRLAT